MPDKTIKARTDRLKARNAKRGLTQVKVWIPESRRSELHQIAENWRAEHNK